MIREGAAGPLTTRLRGVVGQRPFVAPTAGTGEVQVGWIGTHPVGRIGEVDRLTTGAIDVVLARRLDL